MATAAASEPFASAPIVRGLAILGAFQPGDDWLGHREIARRTAIPESTITRIAQALRRDGFLAYSTRHRKYRLAAAVLGLGFVRLDVLRIARDAAPLLHELADRCSVTVALAERDGLDSVVLAASAGAAPIAMPAMTAGARATALVDARSRVTRRPARRRVRVSARANPAAVCAWASRDAARTRGDRTRTVRA